MVKISGCCALLLGPALLLQACIAHRDQGPLTSGTRAPAAAPAADLPQAGATPTASAAKPNRVVLVDKTLTDDEVKQLIAKRYRPEAHNGTIYYCRREQQLGTHFFTTTCKTGEELKALTQNSQEMLDMRQRISSNVKGQ